MQSIGKAMDQMKLQELLERGQRMAASPEAIAAFEQRVRDATRVESRERFRRASASLRRLVPLRPEVLDAISQHCDPDHEGPSPLRRTAAIASVARWASDERRSVIALLGTVGVGKTTACGLAAMRALLDRRSVVYVKEPTLLRWRKFLRHEKDLDRVLSADLLIIDELGTCLAKDHDDARMAILEVVDDRLAVGRTMLLGNLSRGALGARYDARLVDRLSEVGMIVDVSGESVRGRAA